MSYPAASGNQQCVCQYFTVLMQSAAFQTLFTVLRSCNFSKRESTVLSNTPARQMYTAGGGVSPWEIHALGGLVINEPVCLYTVVLYASRLGCKLGISL